MEKALVYNQKSTGNNSIYSSYERPSRLCQLEEKRKSRYALQIALEKKKREKTERVFEAVKGFGLGFCTMALIVGTCFVIG